MRRKACKKHKLYPVDAFDRSSFGQVEFSFVEDSFDVIVHDEFVLVQRKESCVNVGVGCEYWYNYWGFSQKINKNKKKRKHKQQE